MNRAILVAVSLGILLPAAAIAQEKPGESTKPRETMAPHGATATPQGHMETMRPQPAMRPQQTMNPQAGRPMAQARPLPPRGNQFWHRGQYYNRVHAPAFVYPQGWRYRQWDIGMRLPPVLCAPGFYYADWAALGLQAPPPDYGWVRFGPDLLLVNLLTYEIEDVVYGALL